MSANTQTSQTVEKALKVLDLLYHSPVPLGLTEISQTLDMSTAVVHRLLTTLKNGGMVIQEPRSRCYTLGQIFIDYGNRILSDIPFAPHVEPWMEHLRNVTGETVGFYIHYGTTRMCVLEYVSRQEIHRTVGVGTRIPIYLGASGKVILAHLPENIRENLIRGLKEEMKQQLREDMKKIAEEGHAITEGESSANVAALAVPVLDKNRHIVGALSISGPMFRWNRETMEPFIPEALKAAAAIAESL